LKVLHLGKFFPPHRGGMETHLAALATGQRPEIDVEVVVAASGRRSSEQMVDGVRVRRAATLAVVAATPMCPALFGIVATANADLVHIHHPHPLAMLAYLQCGTHMPAVVSYHSDIVRQRLLGKAVEPIVRRTLERSSAILVASHDYLETSVTLAPYRHKCHVVPYGVDVSARAKRDATAIDRIGRDFGTPLILAVGRLVYYKGFEYLIDAMKDIDGHLVVIGSGPLRGALERRVRLHHLEPRVSLLGDVDDVQPFYDACDVFVLPSIARSEAFGIVQLEAMAAAKPVVNTDIRSGVTFASPHGETGLTVAPADPDALRTAINALLQDATMRRRFGDAGVARVNALFTADRMVQRTLDVYHTILMKPGPA
jgi:glycosyltransferase involved in cell wall biosynthesis